jgi:maleamate amidohydrolase
VSDAVPSPSMARLPIDAFDDVLAPEERAAVERYVADGPESWRVPSPGKRPALVLVDVQENVFGPNVPLAEAVRVSRITIGERAHRALPHIERLLAHARASGWPVLFTCLVPDGARSTDQRYSIRASLSPRPSEDLLEKIRASAFFGTGLTRRLRAAQVDTLVVAGCTTSGCVRATAVDAQQLGLAVVVPYDAVFDRFELSHRIALFDLWLKYAVVSSTDAVVGAAASTTSGGVR